MKNIRFPTGYRIERLTKANPRKHFTSGQDSVDDWLTTKALQNQDKHLSATKLLLDASGQIAGYFTLATGQVDFSELPTDMVRKLPKRVLPAAWLAWLGIAQSHQGRGLGKLLLSQALRDCYEAGKIFAFVVVILDCINDQAKAFYQQFDFIELPGNPYRLFISSAKLDALMEDSD